VCAQSLIVNGPSDGRPMLVGIVDSRGLDIAATVAIIGTYRRYVDAQFGVRGVECSGSMRCLPA
jgi:hypothetical protein